MEPGEARSNAVGWWAGQKADVSWSLALFFLGYKVPLLSYDFVRLETIATAEISLLEFSFFFEVVNR